VIDKLEVSCNIYSFRDYFTTVLLKDYHGTNLNIVINYTLL